ncbi:Glyoxalase-like domain protein [Nonomuraea coxensis DSM 45129]|uniref:Glyoxalase-like domain protein n=1 Tax=Nonomuraea coxensis DSM 45129 TaxID=1122611 RepID=A0ABX8TUV5_9ACTN|nr:glyoxalase superfamily protein [Nonomuraea coxensis]QYC38083.1 Glyoxalase-like domain protein [Nonomuraea coxensis DSM 45129]
MSTQSSTYAIQPILCTADLERSRSFYVEVFGAEEHMRVPGDDGPFSVELRMGGAGLGLVAYGPGAEAPPGRVVVAVFVDDVDALLPLVEKAGGRVRGPADDMPWGQRVAHVTDPDGNLINLTQRL